MQSRLSTAVTAPTSTLYTWYINVKASQGASAGLGRTPRIVFYLATGSKKLDPKALKPQQGHNKVFWRALLPVRGVAGLSLCLGGLLGIVFCGGAYLCWSAYVNLYLPLISTLAGLTSLSTFLFVLISHLAWHLKKKSLASPIRGGHLFFYLTSVAALGTAVLGLSCKFTDLWKKTESIPLAGDRPISVSLPEHLRFSPDSLSKLQSRLPNFRNRAVAADKLPTLVFKLNLNGVSCSTFSRTSVLIDSVSLGHPLSPLVAIEALNKITTLRLSSPTSKANNLGWGTIPQQLYSRNKAIRTLLASWHIFSDNTQLGAGEYNFKHDSKDLLYSNNLTLLPQRIKPLSPAYIASKAQGVGTLVLAKLPSASLGVSSVLTNAGFNFVGVQPTSTKIKTRTWSRV